MKLQNKKTGEIRDFIINKDKIRTSNAVDCWEYSSLAQLNEEWEDYEEPKPYFISEFGDVYPIQGTAFDRKHIEKLKQIGNYFETKEEAEKAVEKLKAWKRLKDKGVMFKEWFWDENYGTCIIIGDSENSYVDDGDDQNREDLDLLFGGEE